MTSMNRSALLWAGLLTTILALTGCGEGPDMIVDGGPCQNTPHLCPPDSGVGDGDVCVPFGNEGDNCDDNVDNDCDGDTDSGDSDCGGTCPGFAVENTMALCTDGVDNDCNGSRDNVMPGMDPQCEPMSCTPGTGPGPDLTEDIRPPDECFAGYDWVDLVPDGRAWTFKMIMSDLNKTWTCCRADSPGTCFNTTMGFSDSSTPGYEPGVSFDGGPFAIGADRNFSRYADADNHANFTFAADGLVNTYVKTNGGVDVTYNCQ
jgi:hypothetical protein